MALASLPGVPHALLQPAARAATTLTVNPAADEINDAPTISPDYTLSVTTDNESPYVFSDDNASRLTVSDVDAGSAGIRTTLSVTGGRLTVGTAAGLTFSSGDGVDDTSMTFVGTVAATNAALDGLRFKPAPGVNGSAVLQVKVDDLGATGLGGPQSVTRSVNIRVMGGFNPDLDCYEELDPAYLQVDVRALIGVNSPAELRAKREALIKYIWGQAGFPSGLMPPTSGVQPNVTPPIAGLENLDTVDQIDLEMPLPANSPAADIKSTVYFIHPKKRVERLMIVHQGHVPPDAEALETNGAARAAAFYVKLGWDVLLIQMPLIGDNHQDELPYNETSDAHALLGRVTGVNALKYYVEPVAASLNYALKTAAYKHVSMTGISGGGWTTALYAALDPRVQVSLPLAGSLPYFLRTGPCGRVEVGDWEQKRVAGFIDYTALYLLGAEGRDRGQLQLQTQYDSCCFWGVRYRTYESTVRKVLAEQGEGAFGVYLTPYQNAYFVHTYTDDALYNSYRFLCAADPTNQPQLTTVPASLTTLEETALALSTPAGGLLSIQNTGVCAGALRVSLSADNGLLSLGSTTGVTVTQGTATPGQSLTIAGNLPNVNNALAGLVFKPAADFNGASALKVSMDNEPLHSFVTPRPRTYTVGITVAPVNDAPSFVKGADQTFAEDSGAQTVKGWAKSISAGPANEAAQKLTFALTSDNSALFSVQPAVDPTSGDLTFTPRANGFGSAVVTVTLKDDGGIANGGRDSSAPQSFKITVTPSADTPSVTGATTNEDTQTSAGLVVTRNPADGAEVTHFKVTEIRRGTLFQNDGKTKINAGQFITVAEGGAGLRFMPAADFEGTAGFDVRASTSNSDAGLGGGTATAAVVVRAVNDVPALNALSDLSILEDAAQQTVSLSGISAGGGETQTLSVTATTDNALLIPNPSVTYTSPGGTGSISLKPAADRSGTATITVTVRDDGGTANGGVDAVSRSFKVTVAAVNDAPSFTQGADQNTVAGAPAQTVAGWATNISAGPADESGQTLTFQVTGNTNPSVFSVAPSVSPAGTLTYTPSASASGSAQITLTLKDGGGVAGGGRDTSPAQTFRITVGPAGTKTTLAATPNPSVFGQAVTLKATVSVLAPSTVTPQGTVTFKDGATTLGTATLDASGVATLSRSTLPAGDRVLTAEYAATPNTLASASAPLTQTVRKAPSALTVASSLNPSARGRSVTFTATVTAQAPTGLVQFKAGGSNLGGAVACAAGAGQSCTAQVSTSDLPAGVHTITADYGGDPNTEPSAGTLAGGQTVGGIVEFSQSLYAVAERAGFVSVTVRRAGDTSAAATVEYSSDDGSVPAVAVPCSATTGIALERCDYTRAAGTLFFAAGETEKTFDVLVNEDSYFEGPETTRLVLSNPSRAAALGRLPAATLQLADDAQGGPNPIDASAFFVRQQYHDFLGREPDASGLAFWVGGIESCGADQGCRDVKRVTTSAAFFLSIEFQETGFYVIRVQRAAFRRKSSDSASRVSHTEFIRDARQVGEGVIIGQPGAEARLDQNKTAYVLRVVSSPEFIQNFPTSLTAGGYVEGLFAAAGVVPTPAEVQKAVDAFGVGGTAGRAAALRAVADSDSVRKDEFIPAFVLMQYYGYLRRNPTDAPNTDDTGYQFWLGKLRTFEGDFQKAEMVRAFILSTEYRQRFGQ